MEQADKNIIESLQSDKTVGIRLMFDRYYRLLVLYADEHLKDLDAAEDVVQELFIRLWESDHFLENINTSLGAYLYIAVKNSCYTYTQKKDVLRNTAEFNQVDIPVEAVVDMDEERIEKVMLAIEELPERTRQVVNAVMIRGLKYRETSEELGISVNTVKFLLKEGMKRLRDHFSSFDKVFLFYLIRKSFRKLY